jgi:hypothetical protein
MQAYTVRRITGADAVNPEAAGTVVAQGTTGEIVSTETGLRVWAGKAGDPFWIEPDVLHSVGHAFQDGTPIHLSGWDPSRAKNLFAGHTVYSIVLEVPDRELHADAGDQRRIGVWAVSTLATDAGGSSINRVGLPMIHPLFTQYNEDLGNRLNAGCPADDFATNGATVAKAVAGSSPQMEQPGIVGPMGKQSRTEFAPTSFPTRLAHLPRSGSPSGTVVRLPTTRPVLCSPWRRTRPLVSGSAKNPSPRSRRRHFRTFPRLVRAGRLGREPVSPATHASFLGLGRRLFGPRQWRGREVFCQCVFAVGYSSWLRNNCIARCAASSSSRVQFTSGVSNNGTPDELRFLGSGSGGCREENCSLKSPK